MKKCKGANVAFLDMLLTTSGIKYSHIIANNEDYYGGQKQVNR